MKERKGFTLIELLVVIAIIAILAAILFPVFAKARESARKASCISNVKQLALAVIQYCGDYDGRGPTAWWYPINGTEYMVQWREKLGPYGAHFWILPSDSSWPAGTLADVNKKLWLCTSGKNTSTYNLKWSNGGYYLPYPQGWYIDKAMYPSETMLLGEAPWENVYGRDPLHNSHMNTHPSAFIGPKEHPWLLGGPSSPMGNYDTIDKVPDYAAAHQGVNVMAMYDGSARTMKPRDMWNDVMYKYQNWWTDQN
mgnify:CR=1 FL=1